MAPVCGEAPVTHSAKRTLQRLLATARFLLHALNGKLFNLLHESSSFSVSSSKLPMQGLTIKGDRANQLKAAKSENERERPPPPPPTPLQFPLSALNQRLDQARYTSLEISQLFTTIHKTGPKIEHLQALSVRSIEVSLEQLLPEGYLPDVSWNQDPSTANGSTIFRAPVHPLPILSNGMTVPGYEAWYKSSKELLYDNEDVFQFLQGRHSSSGRPKLRVAMFRKFWDHLQQMGMYWDTSQEIYEDIPSDAAAPDVMDIDKIYAQTQPTEEANDGEKANQTYRGSRIGTGRDMPARFREEAVFAFVETVAMAFRCRTERPRMEPKVRLQNILIPLPQVGIVYRCPTDRNQAKRGILEGPLLAIQCTNQTVFRREEEVDGEGQGEVSNLLREVGLMLNLAQKRAREGQEEPEPGDGKWWATKPRWGGGPGGEVQSIEGKNDDDPEGSSKGKKRPKRSNAMENWKNLEPGPSLWDKGVLHLQIGKNRDTIGDDVRLLLNKPEKQNQSEMN